jgi:hypothetical protein
VTLGPADVTTVVGGATRCALTDSIGASTATGKHRASVDKGNLGAERMMVCRAGAMADLGWSPTILLRAGLLVKGDTER